VSREARIQIGLGRWGEDWGQVGRKLGTPAVAATYDIANRMVATSQGDQALGDQGLSARTSPGLRDFSNFMWRSRSGGVAPN